MSKKKVFDRRQFIKRATAIAGGTIAFPYLVRSSALGKDDNIAASERIVVACIGTGRKGRHSVDDFCANGNVQVVAVCDVNKEHRDRAKDKVDSAYGNKACKAYNDFRDILASPDIDAVCISTQDHWHALIAVLSAEAGKDMYCEKPLGVAVTESQAVLNAVRRYGIVFQTGTQQRSDRKFCFACELARNGYLGKVHTVKVGAPCPEYERSYQKPTGEEQIPDGLDYDMYVGPAPMKPYNSGRLAWPDWYLIWDYCAGFIVNWGVHHLDIAVWGCPTVASETCELEFKGTYRDDGLTDNINDWQGQFNYESGLKMTYTDNQHGNKQGCTFEGNDGWVHVNRKGIWAEPQSLLEIKLQPSDIHLYDSKNHHDDFVNCIKVRKDPVSSVEAGHKATYLGMIAEIAVRLGRKLKWNPAIERFIDDQQANRMLTRPMRSPWQL